MKDLILPLLVLGFLVLLIVIPNIKIVSDNQALIVEKFGKFHRIIDQKGVYTLIPFVERGIQLVDLGKVNHHFTHDKTTYRYTYKVVDIMAFVYYRLDSLKAFQTDLIQKDLLHPPYDLESIQVLANPYGITIDKFNNNNQ